MLLSHLLEKRIIFICCVKEKTVVKTDIPLSIVNDWQTNAQKAPAKWAVDGIRCMYFCKFLWVFTMFIGRKNPVTFEKQIKELSVFHSILIQFHLETKSSDIMRRPKKF